MKLSDLAQTVGGQLENYGADVDIGGVAPIDAAENGDIAYVGNAAERVLIRNCRASAFITSFGILPGCKVPQLCGNDPYLLFARVVRIFHPPLQYEPGIHPTAVIHESANIGARACIGAYVVIDRDVHIGDDAVLLPHVVIYRGARIGNKFFAHAHAVVREYCCIGDNVVLQNGAMIGTDGFGFVCESPDNQASWRKVIHAGSVTLGDEVEVQSNACINRSEIGYTRIGTGAKIGDLVHVAHRANVGTCSLLSPQVAVAGRVKLGRNVIIAGQAGVAGDCEIADNAVVMAQSGVIGRIEAGKVVSGFPAIDHKEFLRSFAVFRRLPQLIQGLQRASRKYPSPRASSREVTAR
jgi:UDP-3-O-[3-hydroxymyristoyl] glucosamine N-acyltransferase